MRMGTKADGANERNEKSGDNKSEIRNRDEVRAGKKQENK